MRRLTVWLFIIACCAAATAQQATVVEGYASDWASRPFIPRIMTPEISLDQPPLVIGATNATNGLVAGATNSTLELGNLDESNEPAEEYAGTYSGQRFESGVAASQESVGVATLLGAVPQKGHAVRTYTNDDISRVDQGTNTVKFKGRIEELR